MTFNQFHFVNFSRIGFVILLFSFVTNTICGQQKERKALLEKIKETKQSLPEFEKDTSYLSNLIELADQYRFFKEDSLLFYSKDAYELSKEVKYINGQISALKCLGNYYTDTGNHDLAITYYEEGIQLAKKFNKLKGQTILLNCLAYEYELKNNFTTALELYMSAIDIAESNGMFGLQSSITENVALLYMDQKDYEQALLLYKEVIKINETIDDEFLKAKSNSNMGTLYTDLGDYEKAMDYINQAIEYFEVKKINEWLVYAYTVKGIIYLNQKKYNWAINWFNQANALNKSVEDDRERVRLYHSYATAYFGLGNLALSEDYALKCYNTAKRMNWPGGINLGAEALYLVNKQKNNAEQALAFHEIYHSISDSISRKENQQSLSLLKAKAKYEKQKEELIVANEKAVAMQRTYIYLSLAIVLIILAIMIPLYFNRKRLARLYQQLIEKTNALQKSEADLRKIDRTKNQLFSIIGHDLRGPIGGLQGLLTLFANKEIPADQFSNFIPKLKSDVDHILFSLNNLLSWGQAQLKHNVTKPGIVTLKNSAKDCIKLLRENANKKGIRLVEKIPDFATAWVDTNQLEVIIRNLLSNAIKFTPENGTVTISAEDEVDHWKVSVRDTGIGMDKEVIRRIFSEDEKITTFGTNNEKGTGLGLSLCQEMVEKNRGEIWVESELQIGTTFHFTIPKIREEEFKEAI